MRKKKAESESHENSERWLLSYADFITLLMVFFIIMYSMSKVDKVKFYQLAQSLNTALSGGTGTISTGDKNTNILNDEFDWPTEIETSDDLTPEEKAAAEKAAAEEAARQVEMQNLKDLEDQLAAYFVREDLSDSVLLHIDSRGLVVSLNATVLFDSGSAEIKPEMAATLIDVGGILNKLDNFIRIEGHTDNVPVGNSRYKNNWELSNARATNVIETFIDQVGIDPQKLVAAGYSEYKPVDTNDTPEGRSRNRRVDIIILNRKYSDFENLSAEDNISPEKTPAQIMEEGAANDSDNSDDADNSDNTVNPDNPDNVNNTADSTAPAIIITEPATLADSTDLTDSTGLNGLNERTE